MKKLFFKLGSWVRSFFISKSEKPIWLEEVLTKKQEENEETTVNENLLDLQQIKQEVKFETKKNKKLTISTGETFELTEKQLLFYNIIKDIQEKATPLGDLILHNYLIEKYKYMSNIELRQLIQTTKPKLSAHNKTFKGMFKSGLLYRVSRNVYGVKI